MPNTLANLARVASSTTGTGTLTLGAAATGCLTFADAGVTNGAVVTYAIEDYDGSGNIIAREIGVGTYSTTGPTLSRDTVYASTNAGSKIDCSGLQHVFVTASKEDFASLLTSAAAAAAYQPLDADLTALAGLATSGMVARTGAGTLATRTITGPAEGISVSNGDGVSGNPTLALANDLAALEALSGTNTLYYRSGADTWSAVTVNASLGFSGGTLGGSLASNYQPLDSELTAIAGLTSAADRLPYFTGSGAAALATFTTAGRNLVDDATAADQRTTLGLGTAATQNTGTSGANVPLLSTGNTWSAANTFTTANSYGAPVTLQSTNADANEGPFLLFRRASASPANGDRIGSFLWQMYTSDSPAIFATTAAMTCFVPVEVTTSGTSQLVFGTRYAGAYGDRLFISGGIYTAGATGSDKGVDTINTNTLFEAGVSLAAKYAALASSNTFTQPQKMPSYTVAALPAGSAGLIAFASNGRKNGEGAGLGTGVLVFHDGTAWRACDTGATVAA